MICGIKEAQDFSEITKQGIVRSVSLLSSGKRLPFVRGLALKMSSISLSLCFRLESGADISR